MTGLLNMLGLCTMEQLHRNMDEVVGAKQELARREAEIADLRNDLSRAMSALRDERTRKEKEMEKGGNGAAACQQGGNGAEGVPGQDDADAG